MAKSFEGPQFGENKPGEPQLIQREVLDDGHFVETYSLPRGHISQLRGWYKDGQRAATLDEALQVGQTPDEEVSYLDEKFKES